ncbi:MAG: BamA/TamA family outer membrane protein [Candidatus Marinimicrobia bacterium]|nr:BamA/TamA family outer membrane protein [Candidatus Neomarinimicrobiota bacterium]
MKRLPLLILALFTILTAQSTWMFSDRVHPELKWQTISTKHFNIHYHQGIEDIAKEGAIIAEHVRPTLLAQMDLDTIPRIDIIFTTEDEIMNGFAMWMYNTFIWVDQNDAAIWLEKGKWLEQVLSHELQHIVLLHKTRSWFPDPLGRLISGLPGWVVEGTAEYETESWRPYRADLSHKKHILQNKMSSMDPHHDGFSKMLYWADRFGDSTITKTLAYRNGLKTFSFGEGFKKATGITVSQFNEDWRRHMNTYYYGYRSQKESYKEMGEVFTLPIKKMQSFSFYEDSTKIALLGLFDKAQQDVSLIIANQDTAKERKRFEKWEKGMEKLKKKEKKTKKDSLALEKPYKGKMLWKKEEVDFGQFHQSLSWSPKGENLAYSKYHFGKNQSLVYDIKVYNTEEKKHRWLTKSQRASYPVWLDSNTIAYVAHHNNVSNIYTLDIASEEPKPLTNFTDNTQITFLSVSPDQSLIAFAMSPKNANMDIYTLSVKSGDLKQITTEPMADIGPVWHPDGTAISYTSNANGVPNIHTINLSTGRTTVNTDAGDGIWTQQWMPNDSLILASSLGDVDSVRLVKVNPFRKPYTKPLSLRENYTSWLKAGPDVSFVNEKTDSLPEISDPQKYKFTKHMRPFIKLLIPSPSPFGMFSWTDALGRNIFTTVGFLNPTDINTSGFLFDYTTANFGPLWSISISKNIEGTFRRYNQSNMIDLKDGLSFSMTHPMNFGKSLSSTHNISLRTTFFNHRVTVGNKTDKKTGELIPLDTSKYVDLPIPEQGKEGLISLRYVWSNKRPHKWNFLHPTQGYGVLAQVDYANKNVFGSFSYTRFKTDMYANLPVGKTALFFRIKTMMYSGKPPAQDFLGLTDDEPIYISGIGPSEFLPENHNPRGWSGNRLGDKLIYGSLEYRVPIAPKIASFNLISDFGNAWSSDIDKEAMVVTGGYELRITLGPFVLSGGEAQTIDDWKNDKKPLRYYRLALTNPF